MFSLRADHTSGAPEAEPADLSPHASYGHFGRAPDKDGGHSPGKKTDLVPALKGGSDFCSLSPRLRGESQRLRAGEGEPPHTSLSDIRGGSPSPQPLPGKSGARELIAPIKRPVSFRIDKLKFIRSGTTHDCRRQEARFTDYIVKESRSPSSARKEISIARPKCRPDGNPREYGPKQVLKGARIAVPAHDDPDRGSDRDAGRPRRRYPLGVLQHLIRRKTTPRRRSPPPASRVRVKGETLTDYWDYTAKLFDWHGAARPT